MILEFNAKKEGILQKKLKRFEELKIGYFNQSLTDKEEIEFNKLEKWLKIHNEEIKKAI